MGFLKNLGYAASGGGLFGVKKFRKGAEKLLFGTPEKNYQQSILGPEQQPLYQQLLNAGKERGAGGAFGDAADYYRDILSNDPAAFEAFIAPEQRRFDEEIIPGLSEQFAGMGSGALSSSGFRNAAVNAGTDLSERIAAIRANLRNQAAQGLTGIGQQGLNQYNENIHRPREPGLLETAAPVVAQAAAAYYGGAAGAGAGGISSKGQTSPYGGQQANSARASANLGRWR